MEKKPDFKNLYALHLPESLRAKASDELINLEQQTELDQSPAPLVSFIISDADLKRRVRSDSPSWEWIHMPCLPAMRFYEEEAQRRIRKKDVMGAIVSYLASKHNSLEFSIGMRRLSNVALLNPSELQAAVKVCDENYSHLERDVIDALGQEHFLPDIKNLNQYLKELRKARGILRTLNLCKFLNETSPEKLQEWRAFARQQGWYSRAGIISSHLKEPSEETQDSMNRVRTYSWDAPGTTRRIIESGMYSALHEKNFKTFAQWTQLYAERRSTLENGTYGRRTFGGRGWFVEEQAYDSEDHRMVWEQRDVSPLLFHAVLYGGNAKNNRSLPNRVQAAHIYIEHMPDIIPMVKKFWSDLSPKDKKEDYPYLPRICKKLSIHL